MGSKLVTNRALDGSCDETALQYVYNMFSAASAGQTQLQSVILIEQLIGLLFYRASPVPLTALADKTKNSV